MFYRNWKKQRFMADNWDSEINKESTTATSSDIVMRSASGATNHSGVVMRKSAINNSLLDLTDASEKMARRGSVGSLDSGMSISFQSNSIFNNHQCSQSYHRSPRVNGETRGQQPHSSSKHNHHWNYFQVPPLFLFPTPMKLASWKKRNEYFILFAR